MPAPLGEKCRPVWASMRLIKRKKGNFDSKILTLCASGSEPFRRLTRWYRQSVPQYVLFDEFLYRYARRFGAKIDKERMREVFQIANARYGYWCTRNCLSNLEGYGPLVAHDVNGDRFAIRLVPIGLYGERAGVEGVSMVAVDYARQQIKEKHKKATPLKIEVLEMVYITQFIWRQKKSQKTVMVRKEL